MAHVLVPVLLLLLLRHFCLLLLILLVLLLVDDLPPQSHRPPSHRLIRAGQRWQPVQLALFAALVVAKLLAGPAALCARLRRGGCPTSLRNNLLPCSVTKSAWERTLPSSSSFFSREGKLEGAAGRAARCGLLLGWGCSARMLEGR